MKRGEKRLGEILVSNGVVSAAQLEDAIAEQKLTKEFLGVILVKNRYVSEKEMLKALAAQFNVPIMSLKDIYIDWELVKRFSPSLVLENKCFPVKKDEWTITIAITNPLDAWALKKAENEARGFSPKFVLTSLSDMEEIAKRYEQFMRGRVSGML